MASNSDPPNPPAADPTASEPEAQPEAEAEPEAVTEAEPEAKAETEAEALTEAKAEARPEAPKDGPGGGGGRRKGRARHFLWLAFSPAGHVHHVPVDPRRFTLKAGDLAVVETDRGLSVARVLREPTLSDEVHPSRRVRKVVRPAREPDLITYAEGKAREPELLAQAREITARTKPEIRLLGVDHQAIGNKLTVYFASERRVDFRALVRELSQGVGLRIEMRQVGVRDEAKRCGGLGHCGRELCCGTFLSEFCAVSIRMAKDQNLALSPNKISGLCGRLMCCLSYEHPEYAALRKKLPKAGKRVLTSAGPGRVLSVDVLQQRFAFLADDGQRQILEGDAVERDEEGRPIRPPPPSGPPGPRRGDGKPPRGRGAREERRPDPRPRKGRSGPPQETSDDGKAPKGGRKRSGGRRSRRGRSRKPPAGGGKE